MRVCMHVGAYMGMFADCKQAFLPAASCEAQRPICLPRLPFLLVVDALSREPSRLRQRPATDDRPPVTNDLIGARALEDFRGEDTSRQLSPQPDCRKETKRKPTSPWVGWILTRRGSRAGAWRNAPRTPAGPWPGRTLEPASMTLPLGGEMIRSPQGSSPETEKEDVIPVATRAERVPPLRTPGTRGNGGRRSQ
jgi:hypothetical protein